MTDPNYTHITVLLDESGSMESLADDTRGGFNSFLAEQQRVPGKATMTVCKFSGKYTILNELTPLADIQPLNHATYVPLGGTALLDAMGRCIADLGSTLSAMPEKSRPGKILFLIITDGQENASTDYTKAQIASMVSLQEQTYKWNFIYIGANVDAFHESAQLGMRSSNALGYNATSKGTEHVYSTLAGSVSAVRTAKGISGRSLDLYASAANVDQAVSLDYNAILQNQVAPEPVPEETPVSKP